MHPPNPPSGATLGLQALIALGSGEPAIDMGVSFDINFKKTFGSDYVKLFDIQSPPSQSRFADPATTWNPDPQFYYTRRLKRLQSGEEDKLPSILPEGFPTKMPASSLVWSGQELSELDYVCHLGDEDVKELEDALAHFKGLNLPISGVSRATFPLPTLGEKVIKLSGKLYGDNNNGRGFFVLRGLNPDKYDAAENVTLFNGVASYVGTHKGRQDEKNNYILHLKDLRHLTTAPDNVRQAPYTNVPQPFHTDTPELLGTYTLHPAARGGRTLLASAWNIYNSLPTSHIASLASPSWAFDSFRRPGPAYKSRALLYALPSPFGPRVLLYFSRRPLTGSPVSSRTPGIPRLTDAQSHVLDTLHFTAAAHSVALQQVKGDLVFWNNFVLVHAREGWEDVAGMEGRHLLRIWMRDEERAQEWGGVPEECKEHWDAAFGGGEEVWGEEKWPVVPIVEYEFVTTQKRSSGHA